VSTTHKALRPIRTVEKAFQHVCVDDDGLERADKQFIICCQELYELKFITVLMDSLRLISEEIQAYINPFFVEIREGNNRFIGFATKSRVACLNEILIWKANDT
jgi:Holliday junction resolvasome RuvABC ATP-dependent DNA helicase subunit